MADARLEALTARLRLWERVAIGFSGGVDSTFLLAIAVKTLGQDRVLAVTAVSDTYTKEEREAAAAIAAKLHVRHVLLTTDEFSDEDFAANPPDRCYFCKKAFFSKLIAYAKSLGFAHVLDGTNADDAEDYRPGARVRYEIAIESPLAEEGFTKEMIRRYSKQMKLPTWNKPANPCLASRFPYGERITREAVALVGAAESFLRSLGFPVVRVRHHGKLARIEVPERFIAKITRTAARKKIWKKLAELGYTWIAVDVAGYRMGSMNEALDSETIRRMRDT
jgi:uncharacterized protein